MGDRRGIGRTEVLVVIAVVAVLALVTIPLWLGTSKKSKRAEVPLNVDAIKTAEITYEAGFHEYVSAEAAPRAMTAVDPEKVAWEPTEGFVELAWQPPTEEVWGAYKVVAGEEGFTVTGTCDVDGDGKRAIYTATQSDNATRVTDESVY